MYFRDSVAFTVGRLETGGALRREDAEKYALKAFAEAGVAPPGAFEIEAFESEGGWLVFASPQRPHEIYIRFDTSDDFLDALRAHGLGGVYAQGWDTGVFTVRLYGERGKVSVCAARLCEYGTPFEAPEGFALHLAEQAG